MSKHKLEQHEVDKIVAGHLDRVKAVSAATKSDRAHRMRVISEYNEMIQNSHRTEPFNWFMEQRKRA